LHHQVGVLNWVVVTKVSQNPYTHVSVLSIVLVSGPKLDL